MKKDAIVNVFHILVSKKFLHLGIFVISAVVGLGLLSQPAVAAQATYQYSGLAFTLFSCGPNNENTTTIDCAVPGPNDNTSYTATDHLSITLSFDAPLAANLNYQDVTSVAGFLLTMNDGHQTLTTPAAGVIAKVSTNASGNIIGPWLLVINEGNAANSGISSENEPPVQPFVQDQGTLSCCPPTVQGDLAINQNLPGTWNSGNSTPSELVTSLITVVQGMNIPNQGNSLLSQLNQVKADISAQNGAACQNLNAFANHVNAQTGKKITTAQANQILSAVAGLRTALSCRL